MTEDFIEQLENNPDFRMKLGKAINKPFVKEFANSIITTSDIE
jgi:hypothetical protein